MGKRFQGKSKTGRRELNPTDAFRKQQRNKEKKRNKFERRQVREEALMKKNPRLIKEELNSLNHMAIIGQLDAAGFKRREKLESLWGLVRQRIEAEKVARSATLDGVPSNVDRSLEDSCISLGNPLDAATANSRDDSSDDEESSASSENELDVSEEERTPLTFVGDEVGREFPEGEAAASSETQEISVWPPTASSSSFIKANPVVMKEEISPTAEDDSKKIPLDFTQLKNPEKPILPPRPPPRPEAMKQEEIPQIPLHEAKTPSLGLSSAPPLPRGLPPPSSMATAPRVANTTHIPSMVSPMIPHPQMADLNGPIVGPVFPALNFPMGEVAQPPTGHLLPPIVPPLGMFRMPLPVLPSVRGLVPNANAASGRLSDSSVLVGAGGVPIFGNPGFEHMMNVLPGGTPQSKATSFTPSGPQYSPHLLEADENPHTESDSLIEQRPSPLKKSFPDTSQIQGNFLEGVDSVASRSYHRSSASTAETPPSTTKSSPPKSSSMAALFVPTQLRLQHKDDSKRKFKSQQVSSLNQVTAFSTGLHRAVGKISNLDDLKGKSGVIGSRSVTESPTPPRASASISSKGDAKKASNKASSTKDIDKAFNEFLKEVERI